MLWSQKRMDNIFDNFIICLYIWHFVQTFLIPLEHCTIINNFLNLFISNFPFFSYKYTNIPKVNNNNHHKVSSVPILKIFTFHLVCLLLKNNLNFRYNLPITHSFLTFATLAFDFWSSKLKEFLCTKPFCISLSTDVPFLMG